ncbi:GntR family transcriptional regulator [Pseudomonas sp. R3.Fl]|uniref:Transcriptional regulator, GntR family n=1 Tax=Pseudomonas delhiensis TaxID=366289 RepID=A0A239HLF7_9PSED|nr:MULTISPECIES: GntR family transcriptional regulator [Pseudomonas]MCL6689881.1 GntR family transcriptional regulator [Pseudomonas sp. R3.Fl]MCP1606160.1 DNA-binding GntR family transcriptional regulator [Pseudomonas citronellolis]MCP1641533.1 DNA-binding GntR family transcriptional regulator [Pseudomonas citronellolis]MCP1656866.1 DNA-binding GntR family transcriptional regulator [Pseudomonas citronellolis]MCP1664451.1 DNA-binding GntR family transcriptional regulator [Pseudomonas citronello
MKRLPLDDSFKVNRNPVTLREIVLDKLRGAILNFQLLPGDRLVERDLCDRLGVSRTSVREALRHLESEGLVEFADAKGPRVAIITLEDACDIYELRCVLEGMIVQLFTLNAKAKDIRALERALEENRKALEEGDLQQVLDSVQGFYDVLLEGSGNRIAATQLRQLQARISYLRATSVSQANRRGASNQEMEKIVAAIKSGDPAAAHQASVDHVRAAAKVALDYLKSKQEEGGKVREIATPIVLKEPRIGR